MRDAATTPGLGWVSLHRHVEAARCSIAGARLRKSLLVVTPSEYEALMDIVDAANRTGDDAVLAAVMRWKDSHAID